MLQSLKRLRPLTLSYSSPYSPCSVPLSSSRTIQFRPLSSSESKTPSFPSSSPATGDDEWNDAWESAWLPRDLSPESRAPWESDVSFPSATAAAEVDAEMKAFVAEMDEQWGERRAARRSPVAKAAAEETKDGRRERKEEGDEYRVRKQRIHAGLWMKEIERMEEARIGDDSAANAGDDIDRLLDSCSEIFDFGNADLNDSKTPSTSDFKTKPDGWETTSKTQDGNIWEISQREEDILLQEFERRIAFSKFQIASFIKTHIFSRRRPIDGWKYMIEVIGPNARKGKGSVQRLPSLADPSTQPFREEKPAIAANFTSFRGR